MKKKAVIICSGGMDSTTLLYDILNKGYEVFVLSFDYGQKHKVELNLISKTCLKLGIVKHKIIDLKILNEVASSALTRDNWDVPRGHYADENMKQTVVPNRNMIMLSLAIAYAIDSGATELYYGAHSGDHAIYPDCRPEFVKAMQKVIKLCDWKKVSLVVPYLHLTKADIVKIGLKLNVDYNLTWTCYNGREKACGKCGSCTERLEAFKLNNMEDPIKYEV
ncbi:MAG: 7-cyano-7-deazaguanine synthase QueC [Proteobacteria bacterium]|nr:7-cyano-7-deazaguanine synthase QueC [Pseudomonadota bacterium]